MSNECPQVVAEAMMQVQKAVQKLDHDSTNDFNNYGYVSIDGYYDAIRPMLNEAELMIIPNEVDAVIGNDGKTQKVVFEFIIMHSSGATWSVPIRRTVYIQYSGAQSCGAALSYAEKFIFRTLFKIPTGEHDPTKGRIEEVEETAQITHDADSTKSPKSGEEAKIDFDYEGAPFRIFNGSGSISRQFTDTRTWGIQLKTEMTRNPKLKVVANNQAEITRALSSIAADKSLTDKARQTLTTSIQEMQS